MRSPPVTTRGAKDETYPEFTARVAEDNKRVKAKCAALDQYIPVCESCGQTCNPSDAGKTCRENGMQMSSRWARKKAYETFHNIGSFARGGWSTCVDALAPWLDRVRAGAEDSAT